MPKSIGRIISLRSGAVFFDTLWPGSLLDYISTIRGNIDPCIRWCDVDVHLPAIPSQQCKTLTINQVCVCVLAWASTTMTPSGIPVSMTAVKFLTDLVSSSLGGDVGSLFIREFANRLFPRKSTNQVFPLSLLLCAFKASLVTVSCLLLNALFQWDCSVNVAICFLASDDFRWIFLFQFREHQLRPQTSRQSTGWPHIVAIPRAAGL